MIRAGLILLIAAAALTTISIATGRVGPERRGVAALLTETNPPAGFAYALEPRAFRFPRDHGAHDNYRSEWWYFTGNVDSGGRSFGFQVTVFRFALRPGGVITGSPWRSNQVYLGHVALSDIGRDTFHHAERRARPALGRAGVAGDPIAIWIDDWRIEQTDPGTESWRLRATTEESSLDLSLRATRKVIAQGERGLSRKSAASGNASYYYSIPRFDVAGNIDVGGDAMDVRGSAWFDHEWSTSALAEGQVGWDWFALQLSDGRELMFYQIRDAAGHADPASHGVVINPDGKAEPLTPAQIELAVTDYWRSGASGARYPAAWRIRIASQDLELHVRPRMNAQEWHDNFTYWEGAVSANGTADGEALTALGYVELVGYEPTRGRRLFRKNPIPTKAHATTR